MNQTGQIISTHSLCHEPDDITDGTGEVELRAISVDTAGHGERLDRGLARAIPEFSRSYLQQLIEDGLVRVNAHVCSKASAKLKVGDALSVELRPTPQSQAFRPEHMDLDVVFEDEHILVINKPAGLVVHPAPGNWSGTLLNGLLAFSAHAGLVPRAGIVHRLDKDTSGLMVVARSRAVMDCLVKAIAQRLVNRQYLAVAHKHWGRESPSAVSAPIGRDPRNRLRMAVVDLLQHPGKDARTDVFHVSSGAGACTVRCVLHTGRTHQIRVHMAHLGHPLIADVAYGGAVVHDMSRQALHACKLAFIHPVSGKALQFVCPPPPDIVALCDKLGLSYNFEVEPGGL